MSKLCVKTRVFWIGILLGVLLGNFVYADPVYYTFEGTIDRMQDLYGFADDQGFELGDAVSYTVMVDFFKPGEYTRYDGEVLVVNDDTVYDNFYTDFIQGTGLSLFGEGDHTSEYFTAENNFGSYGYPNGGSMMAGASVIFARSTNDILMIEGDGHASNWSTIGSTITFQDSIRPAGYTYATLLQGSLALTGISDACPGLPSPVPWLCLHSHDA